MLHELANNPNIEDTSELKLKNKRYFGNNIVFCFWNKEPLFSIGPHCKKYKF